MTLSVPQKVRENRVRERASRYGLRLSRSRDRDSLLSGSYGLWSEADKDWAFAGPDGWGWSLDAIEEFLSRAAV